MASYQDRKELQNCPVCLELLKQPRKLPICKHVFCESCIIDTIGKLKTRGDEGGNENENENCFPCPLCRVVNQFPGKTEDLQTWVSTLEIDEQTSDVKIENMEDCMPCKKLNKSTRAVKFCLDCRESLCAQCFEETQKFRGFQGHNLVEINHDINARDSSLKRDMNEFIVEYLACSQHPDKNVAFSCEDHDELCCHHCILTNHRKCSNVIALQDIPKADSEKEINNLERSLNDLSNFCHSVIETIKDSETENKTSAENIRQKITNMRTKVNQIFDVLEGTISQECKATVKKAFISNEAVVQQLQDTIGRLKVSRDLLEKAQAEGIFLPVLIKRLQRRFNELETKTTELAHGLKRFELELKVENTLDNITELDINETTSLALVKETERELIVPKVYGRKVLEYGISKIGTFSIMTGSYPSYCDLIYTLDKRLILVDSKYGFVRLASDAYKPMTACKCTIFNTGDEDNTKTPFSVTVLRNGTLIVSQPKRKKVFAINMDDKLEIMAEINVPHKAKAVRALRDGDLAVSWTDPVAFGIVSLDFCQLKEKKYFDRDKAGRVIKSFDYMAVDQSACHVIQPCTVDKAVFSFDFHGNPLFSYRHDDLQQPIGVDIDASGNIYVCDVTKACIHILSSTGTPVRIYKEECLESPMAIGFDENKTKFAVTNRFCSGNRKGRDVHVFSLSVISK